MSVITEAGVRLLDEGERLEGSVGSGCSERAALLHPVYYSSLSLSLSLSLCARVRSVREECE